MATWSPDNPNYVKEGEQIDEMLKRPDQRTPLSIAPSTPSIVTKPPRQPKTVEARAYEDDALKRGLGQYSITHGLTNQTKQRSKK